uniref:Odorant-binding protein 13 n=1 Tax=Yemma signatus TaxID=300820 RepID=A0A3G2GRT9_9HEMI|nr:odorant-binding protein 13 [Yemma signatus]
MSFKLLVLVAFVGASLDLAACGGEMEAKELEVLKICKEKTKATQDAVDKFHKMEEDLDDSKEGKCLISCSLAEFGVMNGEGAIDDGNSMAYIKATFPGHVDKVHKIWTSCQERETLGEDLCEYGHALVKCFNEEVTKEKITKS